MLRLGKWGGGDDEASFSERSNHRQRILRAAHEAMHELVFLLRLCRARIRVHPASRRHASERIRHLKHIDGMQRSDPLNARTASKPPLLAFRSVAEKGPTIPFTLSDCLELIDWTGRARRNSKRGAIDAKQPGIMQRVNLDADAWCLAMQPRGNVFGRALGQSERVSMPLCEIRTTARHRRSGRFPNLWDVSTLGQVGVLGSAGKKEAAVVSGLIA
jgi:hypothetical protein